MAEYHGPEVWGDRVWGWGPILSLHLKRKWGDVVFDEFMRDYTETLSWEIASPEFMQALAEKHCACDLQNLFDEWVYP